MGVSVPFEHQVHYWVGNLVPRVSQCSTLGFDFSRGMSHRDWERGWYPQFERCSTYRLLGFNFSRRMAFLAFGSLS